MPRLPGQEIAGRFSASAAVPVSTADTGDSPSLHAFHPLYERTIYVMCHPEKNATLVYEAIAIFGNLSHPRVATYGHFWKPVEKWHDVDNTLDLGAQN